MFPKKSVPAAAWGGLFFPAFPSVNRPEVKDLLIRGQVPPKVK
jgi:hypothetical protein